ncbi:MAG TPA: tetratricopeptide repeat protein [Steroidobacteraceae bacterium]
MNKLFCCVLLGLSAAAAHAQAVRLVEDVGASEQRGYVAVTVVFGCTLRYLSHTPATSGDAVQVRLSAGPDCGPPSNTIEQPLSVGGNGFVRSIEVMRPFGTDVEMRIGWARAEQFVIVPSFDGRGLRIRLLRPEAAKVTVDAVPQGTSTYAVNLDSSKEPYSQEMLAAAAAATGVRAYVSEILVDDERWYRLRAGPFVTEADARRVLMKARTDYPKSWVAIADDEELTAVGTPTAVGHVEAAPTHAATTLTSPDLAKTLKQAKDAVRRKDYATAVPLLTKLLEQPEFPQRAEAQELMGLVHERSGQLAHAKTDYEEYLRRYPQGPAVDRVKKRLRAIAFATRPSQGGRVAGDEDSAWRIYGGYSQIYRQDSTTINNATTTTDLTTQNALINDVSLVARRRGERFDFSTRAAAGYTVDMLQDGPGNQSRITTFFAELNDRDLDWTARLGRQSGNAGGVFGTFDGLYAGYQVRPRFRLNGYFGYPVESTSDGPLTDRQFYGLSADFGTFANAWDFSVYAITQDYFGAIDRQALGGEVRYFKPGITFVGLVDYDLHYQDLNNVLLLGTFALPARWTVNFNIDHRKSPSLTTRNAMIGQPVTRFDQLYDLFSRNEIEQLARDRTAESDTITLSASRPLGEHWQWSTDVAAMQLGGTPASGGVAATQDGGTDVAVATQLLGFGLFGRGDVSTFGVQYQTSDTLQTLSLGLGTQFPIGERWRLQPRLRIDQRRFDADHSTQTTYVPTVRTELRVKRFTMELEGGAEIGSRDFGQTTEDTTRYYFSLGYRYDF